MVFLLNLIKKIKKWSLNLYDFSRKKNSNINNGNFTKFPIIVKLALKHF